MDLELYHQPPKEDIDIPPLLFVHGAWHGGWCWDEYFLPWFSDRGYDTYALSLRGHGNSPNNKSLRRLRIRDYVDDVVQTIHKLPGYPILIGHSMGGTIVQKYLENHTAAGAVLMASNPPSGVIRTTLKIVRKYPLSFLKANFLLSLYPVVDSPDRVRNLFFSSEISEEKLKLYHQKMQDESFLAFLDMLILDLPTPHKIDIPILVMGSESDAVISPKAIQETAKAYSIEPVFLKGLGHDMMLEPNWNKAANCILDWLKRETF